jgi:hypothetical protein
MFKNPQMNHILEKAKRWTEKTWMEAPVLWSERPPVYRKYVVEPSISKIIKQLGPNKSGNPDIIIVLFFFGINKRDIFQKSAIGIEK